MMGFTWKIAGSDGFRVIGLIPHKTVYPASLHKMMGFELTRRWFNMILPTGFLKHVKNAIA